ncbi:caspase activity and apoptosis inhibitor 1 [Parasteatoda tepidariorum]|uniref:caspase activity and apoptosis inhibitor 1 n=1 Tax=Parasteatoda tepidariorum TaxID=114398 RepID=UPI00077FE029|nr:caspase activity and apoptosis inhibitor 1 [Parasteatoda tepidariorum]
MKKSKSKSNTKKKEKVSTLKLKKKRNSSPHTEGSSKIIKKEQVPRKSRWEESAKVDQDLKKTETSVLPMKTEKEDVTESPRIKSLLEDKKKLVEQLFVTVSGKTLDDLIPDYLRKRPLDELKKLCLAEIEKMSKEEILDIISGKGPPLFKEQETQTKLSENSNDSVSPANEDLKTEKENEQVGNIAFKEEINVCGSQNQTLPEVLDEVAKDLGTSEGDAELLELEMRARAIRSLLKLKSNEEFDLDSNLLEDE